MSIYAKISEENIVENVIIADASYISTLGERWILLDESTGMANSGLEYSQSKNKFKQEQPFPSWNFDEDSYSWISPDGLKPSDGEWVWDEANTEWIEVTSTPEY
jgi:hypothetical protein